MNILSKTTVTITITITTIPITLIIITITVVIIIIVIVIVIVVIVIVITISITSTSLLFKIIDIEVIKSSMAFLSNQICSRLALACGKRWHLEVIILDMLSKHEYEELEHITS